MQIIETPTLAFYSTRVHNTDALILIHRTMPRIWLWDFTVSVSWLDIYWCKRKGKTNSTKTKITVLFLESTLSSFCRLRNYCAIFQVSIAISMHFGTFIRTMTQDHLINGVYIFVCMHVVCKIHSILLNLCTVFLYDSVQHSAAHCTLHWRYVNAAIRNVWFQIWGSKS